MITLGGKSEAPESYGQRAKPGTRIWKATIVKTRGKIAGRNLIHANGTAVPCLLQDLRQGKGRRVRG